MDLATSKYFQSPSIFESNGEPPLEGRTSFYGKTKDDPFADSFHDPLCKLNLKETSEFVKSLPIANRGVLEVSTQRRRDGANSVTQRRVVESPSTPGRPVFSFSVRNLSRKNVPSKWDEAEKWLVCNDSPAHVSKPSETTKIIKQCDNFKQQTQVFAEKSRVIEEKVSKVISTFPESATLLQNNNSLRAFSGVSDLHLKDKFMDNVESILPTKEGFLFKNTPSNTMKVAGTQIIHEIQHRDIGTEMTPLGSSTTSRCPTPFKSTSPARHNTPASRSGPLIQSGDDNENNNTTIDFSQLQEFHLAKLQLGTQFDSVTSNWSSREEEEEEISKSLRHFETGNECRKSISDSRAAAWEEDEKNKSCNRYQREEAKIQAWVNLQNAKAEAQSKKLEVKIERMRSNLEEKLMKRLTIVHRKAEEWKEAARQQHSEQIQKATEQARKINWDHSYFSGHSVSCGCFSLP